MRRSVREILRKHKIHSVFVLGLLLATVLQFSCAPSPPIATVTIEGFPFPLPAVLADPMSSGLEAPSIQDTTRLESWVAEEHYVKRTINMSTGQVIDIVASSDQLIYWSQEHPGFLSLEIIPGSQAGPRLVDQNKVRAIFFKVDPWCRVFNEAEPSAGSQSTTYRTAVRFIAWNNGQYDVAFTNYGRISASLDYKVYDVGTVADFDRYQTWALQRMKQYFP
jgi:hypothetical protein